MTIEQELLSAARRDGSERHGYADILTRAATALAKAREAGVEFLKRADYCREAAEDDRLIGDFPLTRDMYDQARKPFVEALAALKE